MTARSVLVCEGDEAVAFRIREVLEAAGFVVVLAERAAPPLEVEDLDLSDVLDVWLGEKKEGR
jgi:hypothetical protein